MAEGRFSWRALRPVLLAGAATLTWLTFSSPAASADALSDTTSLLGGVTSSVSSVTGKIAGPAPAVPDPHPAAAGLIQPVAGQVSVVTETLVAAVPVANRVVPAGAVPAVVAPVAGVVDGAAAAVVDVVVPPVAGAVPVLEPVVQPVADLVTGAAPLPVVVPELPIVAGADDLHEDAGLSGGPTVISAGGRAASEGAGAHVDGAAPAAAVLDGAEGAAPTAFSAGTVALAGTSFPLRSPVAAAPEYGHIGMVDPSPGPAQVPAVPGSGTGSGASSSVASGSAAWLSPFNFDFPVPGALRAGETSEHVPAPVSLDPGSSPD